MVQRRRKSRWKIAVNTTLYNWLEALVWVPIALTLVFTFFGRITPVDGISMLPTLQARDVMLIQSLGYTPRQGDVVVLTKPFATITGPIVKRVVAVGGQQVDIDYAAGTVSVDGVVLDEPYLLEGMAEPWYENHTSVVVPDGSIFVMGDNRNHSADSREERLGYIHEDYVLGKAALALWPLDRVGLM